MFEYQAKAYIMDEDGDVEEVVYVFDSADQLDADEVLEEVMYHHRCEQGKLVSYSEIKI